MQHADLKKTPTVPAAPTRLQRDVVARIVEMVRAQELPRGTALTELSVARDLRVSRTPARAALSWLAAQGLVKKKPGEGFLTVRAPAQFAVANLEVPVADADQLFLAIARERNAGRLPPDVSEADLMRRFDVTRPTLLKVLARLAEVGMVERRAGHGWRFVPNDHDDDAQSESYRFRMLFEPAALLEPNFSLPPHWLDDMRQRHLAMLKRRWTDADAIGLFEMNAEFHEGLCAASGNRFFQMAMEQQNRLRRFVNYDWNHGRERMVASCAEHMEIIDRLDAGDREIASALMRRHLDKASKVGDLSMPNVQGGF
jgi:DNA-binding GntR family transcriptional regulator